ncbi:hypothetical protein [Fibrella forsythiae]|uniref:Uncharacterized protein n=1 Tax=Fibrella forsythiae TaxID=2817061 RepID=A0ABS3JE07_9BACT|nr:hypothetical protein [Fibrella forsythiae]MBO0947504.1 hypothetical protein [Fibrella forsythiae]
MSQEGAYTDKLQSLIESTSKGEIYWEQQNPSTYYYESSLLIGDKFVTSIQRIGPMGIGGYIFQIINSETSEVVLDIKTISKTMMLPVFNSSAFDYTEVLQSLYQRVELYVSNRANIILGGTIGKFDVTNTNQSPMKLTFVSARRVNLDRDGFDFQYFYTINHGEDTHQIHIVTTTNGAELAWHIGQADLVAYSKRAFVLAVKYIKWHWQTTGTLPDEQRQYFEKRDLARLSDASLDWQGYILILGGDEKVTEL